MLTGLSSSSSFSKSFKLHFNANPSDWRQGSLFHKLVGQKPDHNVRVRFKEGNPIWLYSSDEHSRQVRIENISKTDIAYVRSVGPYEKDAGIFKRMYGELFKWAIPRELVSEKTPMLNLYHDNPNVTPPPHRRLMVAIPILKTMRPSGNIGITNFPGGKYAVCHFLLSEDAFAEAWNWMMMVWLLQRGFELDERVFFERGTGEKIVEGMRYFEIDICVPVTVRK